MEITDDFLDQIKKGNYWQAGEKIVLGVSGGVDSMVLFDLLHHLPEEHRPEIVAAHVNHHLREVSNEEEAFVSDTMKKYAVPVYTHHWDKSEHPDAGMEKEARTVRYQFFNDVARQTKAKYILTAHHRDDQVETVLMRLVRGASLEELTGISTVGKREEYLVLRPLINYSKDMILNYAKAKSLKWREDESNQTMVYTRNRYRNHIIPELKKENPAVEQHIYDFSKGLEELLEVIEPLIEQELAHSFKLSDQHLEIDLSSFLKQKKSFQKIVLRRAIKKLSGQRAYIFSQKHIDLLTDWFVSGGPNTLLELPDQYTAQKEYDTCVITKTKNTIHVDADDDSGARRLELNQWIQLNDNERVGCFTVDDYRLMTEQHSHVIYLDENKLELPLNIRHRKPGDRMKVKGLEGSKKIKDIFIDQKVPKKKRDEAWLVTDDQEQIIWLINYKESPLSLNVLTDTISYVLVYQKGTMQV